MKIKIIYRITEQAARAELAAGRPATISRSVLVVPTAELAAAATLSGDGNEAYVDIVACSPWEDRHLCDADMVLTEDSAGAWALAQLERRRAYDDARAQARAAKEAEHKREYDERLRERSQAVLRVSVSDIPHDGHFQWRSKLGFDPSSTWDPESRVHDEAMVHYRELEAEAERRRGAEKARKEAEAASVECDARTWCAEHAAAKLDAPELQRAAAEGRKVRAALLSVVGRRVYDEVRRVIADLPWATVLEENYGSEPREDVPSRNAYALLDRLKAAEPGLLAAAALPRAEFSFEIRRFDVAPRGTAVWRTGVVVKLSHPWLITVDVEVTILSESLDHEDDHEDD